MRWQEIDMQDPAKSLAREVLQSVQSSRWASRAAGWRESGFLSRFRNGRRGASAQDNHDSDGNGSGI